VFVLLWSTGYVGARFGLPFAEPLTLTALRFAIVVLLLSVLVLITRRSISRDPRMWGHWIVTGVLIHTCFIGGIFFAIDRGVGIGIAALIAGVQPLLTAAAGSVLLGESLGTRQWTGFLVGFAGLSLVVAKGLTDGALPLAGLIGCFVGLPKALRRRDRSSRRVDGPIRRGLRALRHRLLSLRESGNRVEPDCRVGPRLAVHRHVHRRYQYLALSDS
jgi:uncharacterized membrane protein